MGYVVKTGESTTSQGSAEANFHAAENTGPGNGSAVHEAGMRIEESKEAAAEKHAPENEPKKDEPEKDVQAKQVVINDLWSSACIVRGQHHLPKLDHSTACLCASLIPYGVCGFVVARIAEWVDVRMPVSFLSLLY